MKVSGQIIFAERVPDQTIRLFRGPDEYGGGAKWQGSFTKTDDQVYLLLGKEFFSLFSNLLLNHNKLP
jgi:hypothetical protein